MYNRNLRKPHPNKNIFKFSSLKNLNVVMCESTLEFDACFHLEYSPEISKFESQPTGIEYQDGPRVRRYTPDFKITKENNAVEWLEVKPYKVLRSNTFKQEFELKRNAYRQNNENLILVTDKQIRVKPLLSNLQLLHRYADIYVGNLQKEILLSIQLAKQQTVFNIALQFGLRVGECIAICAHMISKGLLLTDLENENLSENSIMIEV